MMNRIAIYDMDKTITRRPTIVPFLFHAARTHHPWRLLLVPLVGGAVCLYLLRLIDRTKLKTINHRLLLGGAMTAAKTQALSTSFAARTMQTNVLPKALEQIARDKAEGYRLVLATASYAFYVDGIGKVLGFDDVIGTKTKADITGAILAKIDGENCYGPGKLRMVQAWMAQNGLNREDCTIRFYSDHVSDAPAFEAADEAYAVNAHAPLAALAHERGWTILDWTR
ncbi:MAG: HAD-IB family hydrolase [Sphingomonadales bacterium]